MSQTPFTRSTIGSLVASRRRRLGAGGAAPPLRPDAPPLRLRLARTGETLIEGHAADPLDPDRRLVVELLLDGVPTALASAELFVPELAVEGPDGETVGDSCYGFLFALDPAVLPFASHAGVRVANSDEPVGAEIALHEPRAFEATQAPAGAVRWVGGLDFEGWVGGELAPFPARIEARIDDTTVAVARADRWREVGRGDGTRPEPGFRLTLPEQWADGHPHEVEILADGRPLPSGPVPFLAFADGLAAHLAAQAETEGERLRGELFDRWFPRSVPFGEFERWEARFPAPVPGLPPGTEILVAVVGEDGADRTLGCPALAAMPGWIGAVLPDREGRFEPGDLRHVLEEEAANCATVLFLRAGTLVRPGGAERLAAALLGEPTAAISFGDALLEAGDDLAAPLARTAFDAERALEQGSAGLPFLMRRDAVLQALAAGAGDLDRLFLAPLEQGAARAAHWHAPGFGFTVPAADPAAPQRLAEAVRAHLARRGLSAEVEPRATATLPAVRVRRAAVEPVTILLDAGGLDESALEHALEALEATRSRTPASVFVSSDRLGEAAAARLRLGGLRVEIAARGVSPARRIGDAAAGLDAPFLCLLNARLVPLDDGWLGELLGRASDPGTGLAAPVLAGLAGDVVEAGLLAELGSAPVPRFRGCGPEDPGFADTLRVAHQVSCVGRQALVTRRADFQALGGFDPVLFPRHLGAADYALKLQALGRRIVVSPDARLVCAEPERALSPLEAAGLAREVAALSARWPRTLAADPFGHPLLRRGTLAFSGLAWPPGDLSARSAAVPAPRPVPPGW